MTILTVTELRQHIETDLVDAALQRVADDAEALINAKAGIITAKTEDFNAFGFPRGRDRILFTVLAIDTVTSILERDNLDDAGTVLSTDDWEKQGGRQLIRVSGGTNSRSLWAQHVTVVYVPLADTAIRIMVQVDLVKLSLMYSGAAREEDGDFEVHHKDSTETAKILSRLETGNSKFPIA